MTAAAYSGLAVAGIIGSPVIITAVLIGGGPYIAYRILKARRDHIRNRRPPDDLSDTGIPIISGAHRLGGSSIGLGSEPRTARLGRAPGRVLPPDEMIVQEDEDFDSGSTRLTAFSEVMVAEARGMVRSGRRLRASGGGAVLESMQVTIVEDEKVGTEAEETDDPFNGADGRESMSEEDPLERPGSSVETCKVARPFVLERRRGSVSGARVARRAVL